MAAALPVDVIRHYIFPHLPAVDILRARAIGWNWNFAYLDGLIPPNTLGQVQPTRGGTIQLGFLLPTDRLQRIATAGIRGLRNFMPLDEEFTGRHARILASCCGFFCIYLREPEEMLVANTLMHELMNINPPIPEEEAYSVGMAVFTLDGVDIANNYSLVVPYLPDFLNHDADANPRMRFRVWSSEVVQWQMHPLVIDLISWDPRNNVRIGSAIYFHMSSHDLVFFDLEGGPASLDLPLHLIGNEGAALCVWQGSPAFMEIHQTNIQIHIFCQHEWTYVDNIQLSPYVEANRWVFQALNMALRNRPIDTPEQALVGAIVVAYADPCWVLIKQRGGWVILDLGPGSSARRVNLGRLHGMFFFSHCSSFLHVFQ